MNDLTSLFYQFLKLYKDDQESISYISSILIEKINIKNNNILLPNSSESENTSQSSTQSRIYAKNFTITYPKEIDKSKCIQTLSDRFKESTIYYDNSDNNSSTFIINCKNRKNIYTNKKFIINGNIPLIRTTDSFKMRKLLDSYNLENNNSQLISYFSSFLNNPNKDDTIIIRGLIKSLLDRIDVLLHSEYMLSCIIVSVMINIGIKEKWANNYRIISVDTKMDYKDKKKSINIENKQRCFRCDLVLTSMNKLFIYEFKFRNGRKNDQLNNALNCIIRKRYLGKVLNYLKRRYYKIYQDIDVCYLVGCSYSIKDKETFVGLDYICKELGGIK